MAGKQMAIGIDLGTTFSRVGCWIDGVVYPHAYTFRKGSGYVGYNPTKTPSFVSFTDDDDPEFQVGDDAYAQAASNTTNTIFDMKRLIGREFNDETVQNDIKLWPFKVMAGGDDKAMICVTTKNGETKEFSPEQISSKVLIHLREKVEAIYNTEIKDAVISVPASFNESQRQATIHAAELAGLNVLRLINEPTAAAICFLRQTHVSECIREKNVVVFDLGGGKFDVSCLTISNEKIEVKAFGGDTHLGGEDFDTRVVNHFVGVFKRIHNTDISGNPRAMRRLRTACEKGKISLCDESTNRGMKDRHVTITLDDLCEGVKCFSEKLTLSEFEELNMDLFNKCMVGVEKCLIDAKMDKKDIDEVILVGGSSRIPKIQELLRVLMNGKELYTSINQHEAIIIGAAVQASIPSGKNERFQNLVLRDVTPLSLGVEIRGELMYVIAPRNTAIPTRVIKEVYTAHDYQTSIKIPVYEGERARSRDNNRLGEMTLDGIKPDLRRNSKIDVCFDLHADGTLDVSARDRDTGRDISIVMNYARSSGEEVRRMIKVANENRTSDEIYLKRGVARYALEIYISRVRNEMKTDLVHMMDDEKKKVENAVNEAVKWLDSRELAEVGEYEEAIKKLMDVMDVVKGVEIGS